MRKLMWLSLGFAVSCCLGAYGFAGAAWIPPGIFLLCRLLSGRWPVLKPAGCIAAGSLLGIAWFSLFSLAVLLPAAQLDGCTVQAEIQITDYSRETNYGCVADGVVTVSDREYPVRVYVNEEVSLVPGDTVTGSFRFGLNAPGAMDEIRYYSGKGIYLMAYQRGDLAFGTASEPNWRCAPSRLRQGIRQILAQSFPERALPFVQALLIGDSSLLPYETDIAFQITGIRHVIGVN